MILLALLLATTPINAKTLKARTESEAVDNAYRKALNEVKKEALDRAWAEAGKGQYSATYCIWHQGYNTSLAFKQPLTIYLTELGIKATFESFNNDCITMDWSK